MVMSLSLKEKKSDVVNQSIRELQAGRDNASGSVTLAISTTTTTVLNPNCSNSCGVQLTPTTADAATAVATTYVSAVSAGSFTITHASNTQADRTFFYRIHGGN